jgi:hypothetical protein
MGLTCSVRQVSGPTRFRGVETLTNDHRARGAAPHSVVGAEGGDEWLKAFPVLVARAVHRRALTLGPPFENGMAAWTVW